MFFRKQKAALNDNRADPDAAARDTADLTVIGPGAQFNGNLDCPGDLRIEGVVRGPLRGRHIHLMAGSCVAGGLTSETIAVDTGARLTGAVWQAQDEDRDGWSSPADDGFRPLTSVRPRASLFGR